MGGALRAALGCHESHHLCAPRCIPAHHCDAEVQLCQPQGDASANARGASHHDCAAPCKGAARGCMARQQHGVLLLREEEGGRAQEHCCSA